MTRPEEIDAHELGRLLDQLADAGVEEPAAREPSHRGRAGVPLPLGAVLAVCSLVLVLVGAAAFLRSEADDSLDTIGGGPSGVDADDPGAADPNTFTIVGGEGTSPTPEFPVDVTTVETVVVDATTIHVGLATEAGEVCVQVSASGSGAMVCESIASLGVSGGVAVRVATPSATIIGGIAADDVEAVRVADSQAGIRDGVFAVSLDGGSGEGSTELATDVAFVRSADAVTPGTGSMVVETGGERFDVEAAVGCAFHSGLLGVHSTAGAFRLDGFGDSVSVDNPIIGMPAGRSAASLTYLEQDDAIVVEFVDWPGRVTLGCAGSAVRLRGGFSWGGEAGSADRGEGATSEASAESQPLDEELSAGQTEHEEVAERLACPSEEAGPDVALGGGFGVLHLDVSEGRGCSLLVIGFGDADGSPVRGTPETTIRLLTDSILQIEVPGLTNSFLREPQQEAVVRAFVATSGPGDSGGSVVVETDGRIMDYGISHNAATGEVTVGVVSGEASSQPSPIFWEHRSMVVASLNGASDGLRLSGYVSAFESTVLVRGIDEDGSVVPLDCAAGCEQSATTDAVRVRTRAPSWAWLEIDLEFGRPVVAVELSLDSEGADVPSWFVVPVGASLPQG